MKKTGANNSRPGGSTRQVVRSSSAASSAPRRTSSSSRASSNKSTGKKKKTPAWVPVVIAAAVLVAGGIGGAVLWKTGFFETKYDITMADGSVVAMTESEIREALITDKFYDGIIIDNISVAGMTKDEALSAVLANQPEAPIDIDISLNLDDEILPLDLSSLPITNNAGEVIDEAYKFLRPTGEEEISVLVDMYNQREALKTNPVNYNSAYTLHSEEIATIVHGALDPYDHEAIEAAITGFNQETCQFEYTPSEEGYTVDIEKAVNDVKELLDSSTYVGIIDVDAEVAVPTLTTAMILEEFGRITSTSTTTTANENRNHNIRITADKINGLCLMPGESFSFNDVVGPRNASTGYREAGVIVNGKSETDFGGGICQVSTTLYQSVIKSDLRIIERHQHQWPSSYAEPGTDAAVDWGSQDFAFSNSSEYPIYIIAGWNPNNSQITVEIYGHLFPNGEYLTFHGQAVSRSSAGTEYIQNTSLPVGTRNTLRGSHDGVTANSWVIRYDANGNEISRTDLAPTVYGAISAQIEVGTLQPDGTQAQFNPSTGAVTVTSSATPTPAPGGDTQPAGGGDTNPTDPPPPPPTDPTDPPAEGGD